ncbi:MAG: M60 family metallopeptidase [Dysgonamonadaceae bacterium]|jgi:hypothetical protein|nr:M60 family metallopeptidase [Dysgonamonadaceae bacterium]
MKKTIFAISCLLSGLFTLQAQESFLTLVPTPGAYAAAIPDDIYIRPSRAVTSGGTYSSDVIGNAIDGDMSTIYHSIDMTGPVTLKFFFETAPVEQLDYIVYYPRTSGTNGNFKEIEVHYRVSGNTQTIKYGDYNFNGATTPSLITFDEPLRNINLIQIVVKSGVGEDGKQFTSCAEMQFYRKSPDTFDYTSLFTDAKCSELKADVTIDDITQEPNDFFRKLALDIYRGDYNSEFRVKAYPAYPRVETLSATNKTSKYGILDNATGVFFDAGEDIILFADSLHGQTVSLRITDFSEGNGFDTNSNYPLFEGLNKFKAANKGLAYIMYHTDNTAAPPVKINLASGRVNGYFDITRHDRDDWQRLLDQTVCPYFDVLGNAAHLLYPVDRFKECTDGLALINVYDSIVTLEQEFIGFNKYGRKTANRVMFLVGYGSLYMSASDLHTNYNDNTLSPQLINARLLRTSAVWGPAHEVGHVHQTRPGFKWVGMSEVSNNVYSLYVQTSFGNTSRLTAENGYQRGFTEIIARGIPHAKLGAYTGDPYFQKLVPFWQLHLYANIIGKPDFYMDLHEQVRVNPSKDYATQSGEIQLDFVRYACDLLETDLTNFFEAWGLIAEIDTMVGDYSSVVQTITAAQIAALKDEIAARPYADNKAPGGLIYLSDATVDVIREQRSIVKGTRTVNGLNVTMTGWSNVMAFEVYNNEGKLVYATPNAKFTLPSSYPSATYKAVGWDGARIDAD